MAYKFLTAFAFLFTVVVAISTYTGTAYGGLAVIIWFLVLSVLAAHKTRMRGYAYTLVIFAAVSAAMYYPQAFISLRGFSTERLIVPLLMLIMFGMGTTMRIDDFNGVVRMPFGVVTGVLCQFSIMPFVGFVLAYFGNLPPEVAAGIILVGCSPGGLASNVMAFIAKANVALSITLTAVSTLLSPIFTPLLMGLLADQYVPIEFLPMFWSILKIVILPIAAGLAYNSAVHGRIHWLDRAMPVVSMVGIAMIIAIITAHGRDSLLSIGPLLVVIVIVHNVVGYGIGYWTGRAIGLSKTDARTIAFEVGMQNSGLASGIAVEMGKVATMGLAPAVFGPLMNISGSALATWWRSRVR